MAIEDEIFLEKKPVDSTTLEKGANAEESVVEPLDSSIGIQQPDTTFWAKYGKYSLISVLTIVGIGVVTYVMIKNRNK